MTEGHLVDVEELRSIEHRTVFLRQIGRPTLVLGSTQDDSVVDTGAATSRGVAVVRRRSGGGAVLLEPQRAVWVDTWVPRGDPLWSADVGTSTIWVGEWWASALAGAALVVHRASPVASPWSRAVCFAGVGTGEVLSRGRKVVGVAQWRGREGVLSHALAYLGVNWSDLVDLLDLGADRDRVRGELEESTAVLREFGVDSVEGFLHPLVDRLPGGPSWEVRTTRS